MVDIREPNERTTQAGAGMFLPRAVVRAVGLPGAVVAAPLAAAGLHAPAESLSNGNSVVNRRMR